MKNFSSPERRGPKGKHKESLTRIGKAIQEARLKKEWTTTELGEKVGVSDASVTQTESGQTIPRKPTVAAYEHHLGVELLRLWEEDMKDREASAAKLPVIDKRTRNSMSAASKKSIDVIQRKDVKRGTKSVRRRPKR